MVKRLWARLWQVTLQPWANSTINLGMSRWKAGSGANHFWDLSRAATGVLGARWGPEDRSDGIGLEEGEMGTLGSPCPDFFDKLLSLGSMGSLLPVPLMFLQRCSISESVDITQADTSHVKTPCGP